MTNIISLTEADTSSEYFPDMRVWWRGRLAVGAHQELCWVKFDPGASYPMHSHPYEQVSIIVQGRLRLTVGDETREVGPGDMWFVPGNIPHGGDVLGDEPVIFIDVYAPPSRGDDSDVTYY
ncbi:MAG: cupin domain-containing protein [Pseudomonadota bacterium]